MNWVQVQSRLLSDVVYGLFLNGAPTDLCPLFSLFGPHRITSFSLWEKKNVFTSALRGSYRDVKCCQNKRGSRKRGRRIKGRGKESQYDSLTTVMGNSTASITIIQLQRMFTWVVAAESKGRLEIVQLGQVPNLPWLPLKQFCVFTKSVTDCLLIILMSVKRFLFLPLHSRFHPSLSGQNYIWSFSCLHNCTLVKCDVIGVLKHQISIKFVN